MMTLGSFGHGAARTEGNGWAVRVGLGPGRGAARVADEEAVADWEMLRADVIVV